MLDFDRHDLSAFFAGIGERSFRASQVVKWIHQRGVMDFNAMTDLSKTLRERLNETVRINPPEIAAQRVSRDGTRKWLVRLEDGNCIETVFIPEDARGTLCISSQAGCALNCTFCSTARQGFNRNLGVAEIIAQLWIARRELDRQAEGGRPITNVVLMGMGEPLLNYKNVVKAITLMLDDDAYGLSRRRITVSTAGVVPALDRLREDSDVSLAVSLHAANDRLRDTLIPLNRKYPLSQLMAACRRYVAGTPRRRVTFEYVMLEGINDQVHHARELIALLRGVPAKVNLIPFNPFPGAAYVCSAQAVIDRFREILLAAGLVTVTRKTRGSDIEAACGQLVGRVEDRTRRRLRDHSRSGKVDNGCCNDASGGCS